MSLHKLLVPINYSKCSINGLRYAGHLANVLNAKIVILHALDNDHISTLSDIKKSKEEHTSKIQAYCNEESSLNEIMTDIYISEKSARAAIKMAVETYDIDLIVMGTEGAEKPLKELVGSFTYHVIEESSVPVFTVPENYTFMPIQLIGFGVDYKQVEGSFALDVVKDFAYSFRSRLDIFHIKKYGEETKFLENHEAKKINQFFKGLQHKFETIESASINDGLNQYIAKSEPGLLVLVPRKYSFFEWLSHESISEQVVQHAKIPVLTIPEYTQPLSGR